MRGLIRLTYAVNKIEAWRDWRKLSASAPKELSEKYQPPANASIKKIDAAIGKLREALKGGDA
jgi:hypothetical protein